MGTNPTRKVDKKPLNLIQYPHMRHISRLLLLCAGSSLVLLTGCQTGRVAGGPYHVTAYRPHDPSKVKVKLSTSTQNLFVMEGDRLLMAVQANVGKPSAPTPHGHFTIYSKQKERRPQSAGPRLSDGLLVRIQAGLWISRRVCLAGAAYPWLRSSPSRSGCSTLRLGPGPYFAGDCQRAGLVVGRAQ